MSAAGLARVALAGGRAYALRYGGDVTRRLPALFCLVFLLPALVAAPAAARCVEDLSKSCCCAGKKGCCKQSQDERPRRGCCSLDAGPSAPTAGAVATPDAAAVADGAPAAVVPPTPRRDRPALDPSRPAAPPPPELFTLHAALLI